MEANYLDQYYNQYEEEGRLLYRHGQVEYITTMKYIHKLAQDAIKEQYRILEVGAGTGRYSVTLAHEGYQVDAVELIDHNLDILRSKILETDHIETRQGNALDLSVYADETFDMTLLLGPMYHLIAEEDRRQALQEAVRVTKKGGYILTAYCMNEASIIQFCFANNCIQEYMAKNKISEEFHCISEPQDLFAMVRTEEIKKLAEGLGTERICLVAADGATQYMRELIDRMDDEVFDLWMQYHLSICERQDLIGATNHSLDILRKE